MENQIEIWKTIEGYEGLYEISNLGNLKRVKNTHYNKSSLDDDGYLHIGLCKNCKSKNFFIHRLVALAFIPNPENKPQVNHKNGIKTDNRVENLEWCTLSENRQHAYKTGLQKGAVGTKAGSSKLTEKQVLEIREIGKTKTLLEIAMIYNVSFQTISRILNRTIWKHI